MARYSPEHKDETRRRMVEAAVTTFRRDGVSAAGLKQIMEELGQTVGGFYRHFPSKSGPGAGGRRTRRPTIARHDADDSRG